VTLLPDRAKEPLKTSLGIAIAYAASMSMGWENPMWAGFTVAFISLATVGHSFRRSILRMLGTLMGGAAALTLLACFAQQRWMLMAALTIYIGFCTYRMLGSRNPYFYFVAAFVSVVILFTGGIESLSAFDTAVARSQETYGISNAMEIGIASATFGLILASLMGGPIAKLLINRYHLKPTSQQPQDIGQSEETAKKGINYLDFLDAILAIHISVILGMLLNEAVAEMGLHLPLFVTCLFAAILITNLIPKSYPRLSGMQWPSRTPAIALIADLALGAFLAMSLMSM
jgi:sodium--glutamate symport carrier gltS